MTKGEQLYEGKAKKVFSTEDPELLIVSYKDDATAFNGEKKAQIESKGVLNNEITSLIFCRQVIAHQIATEFLFLLTGRCAQEEFFFQNLVIHNAICLTCYKIPLSVVLSARVSCGFGFEYVCVVAQRS